MESIKYIFNGSNIWLNIIIFFIAVLGFILTIFFYFKSIKDKKLVFSKQTFRLAKDDLTTIKNIEIKYNDKIVKNLSLTKIAFWNSGKESIKPNDIASTNPLHIKGIGETIIYDYQITYQKSDNNFNIGTVEDNSIKISFEFLDFNDGVVLSIYHSGKNSNDIALTGKLIGVKEITYGLKNEYFTRKLSFLDKPMNSFFNSKNIFVQIIGWILIIPYIFIALPLFAIAIIFDIINDKMITRTPADFYFYDK